MNSSFFCQQSIPLILKILCSITERCLAQAKQTIISIRLLGKPLPGQTGRPGQLCFRPALEAVSHGYGLFLIFQNMLDNRSRRRRRECFLRESCLEAGTERLCKPLRASKGRFQRWSEIWTLSGSYWWECSLLPVLADCGCAWGSWGWSSMRGSWLGEQVWTPVPGW